VIGCVVSAAGLLLLAGIQPDDGYGSLWWGFAIEGAGVGFALTPLTAATVGALPGGQAGSAGGLIYTVRWIGGALGVAVATAVFHAREVERMRQLAEASPAIRVDEGRIDTLLAGSNLGTGNGGGGISAPAGALEAVVRDVLAPGVGGVMLVAAAVSGAGALAALLLRGRRIPTRP
jgi:hypothetical protein